MGSLSQALVAAEQLLAQVLAKVRFWERHVPRQCNARQKKLLNLLRDGAAQLTDRLYYFLQLTRENHLLGS